MQYMLLIYAEESGWDDATPEAQEAEMARWWQYSEELKAAGAMVGGEALESVASATTVRSDGVVTDGPFAETKEALGGYYVIEAPSLDEALEWAKKNPIMGRGCVEVRPIMVFEP